MIINNWYVAAESTEVGDEPVPVRMLGCDFVLFRTATGDAVCLSAICCHRGGDLSRGSRVEGCVRCPYHGWQFNGHGQCVRMPPLGEDIRIPQRARVDAYPVQERYGYIWVFLGDLGEDERPALPDFLPAYGDTDNWRLVRLKRDWNANWARIHENLLDTSHLYLVHSFGRHLPSRMTIWPVEQTDWGGRVVQRFPAKPAPESRSARDPVPGDRPRGESVVTLEFSIIGLMHKNSQQMSSGYDQIIWNCLTPVDAHHTRNFGLQFRNFQKQAGRDEVMLNALQQGLDEDAAVIEHLKPPLTPAAPTREMWMPTDAMERLYREQAAAFGRRLGVIDVRRHEDLARDRALVVPSPGRRRDPAGWIHETVPLAVDGAAARADELLGGMGV